jgi:hypothetical protein
LEENGLAVSWPRVGLVLGAAHVFKCWPEERLSLGPAS